jgi:hypothetical protein
MTEKEYEALYEALEAAHKILPGAKTTANLVHSSMICVQVLRVSA